MYGTIARCRLKPGVEMEMMRLQDEFDEAPPPGYAGVVVYRLDADPSEYMLAVLFEDKASYFANANSPQQDAMYQKLRALLEADPEWHDGEIVHAFWNRGA